MVKKTNTISFSNPNDESETLELTIIRDEWSQGEKYQFKLKFQNGQAATSHLVISSRTRVISFKLDDREGTEFNFSMEIEPYALFSYSDFDIDKLFLIAGKRKKEFIRIY